MLLTKTYRFGIWHIFSNMSLLLMFASFGWLCSYLNTPNNIDERFIGKEIAFSEQLMKSGNVTFPLI